VEESESAVRLEELGLAVVLEGSEEAAPTEVEQV
jgi:hypothetical protein